jgi:hypothetical protein
LWEWWPEEEGRVEGRLLEEEYVCLVIILYGICWDDGEERTFEAVEGRSDG